MKYLNKANQPWYGWYEIVARSVTDNHPERVVNFMMPGFPIIGNLWSTNHIISLMNRIQITNRSSC